MATIVDAALGVFGRVGFARAQMSDVAEAAGVSVGTLYNYVEGKDALLLLCAAYAFDPAEATGEARPLAVSSRKTYITKLRRHLDGLAHLPALDAALAARGAPQDVATECATVIAELFDLVARTRRGMDALERSARDVPDVAALFYGDVRLSLLRTLTEYVTRRARQGRIPVPVDAAITARFAVESVTWLARHRHGDPDGHQLDDDAVRISTVQLVTRAICGEAA